MEPASRMLKRCESERKLYSSFFDKKVWPSHCRKSCSVPKRLQQLLEKRDPSKVVRQLSDPEDKFTAVTAFAAMGRFHQLPAPERMRYVLELARRNDEPFASTRIGFVFGRQPWLSDLPVSGPTELARRHPAYHHRTLIGPSCGAEHVGA